MVSSLFLRSAALSMPLLLAQQALAQTGYTYTLDTTYTGADFFDGWDFYTGADPTNGFVTYVNETEASTDSLISSADGSPAIMRADYSETLASDGSDGGRKSVRIATQKTWTHGLFIGDFNHMPGGICGTWPAFWTLGDGTWPANGEIDIIEGVNSATSNLMSLHTSPNCTIAGADELGTLQTSDCNTAVNYNSGCGVTADTTESYGSGFNSAGGGVYAMQWTSDYIRIWFFASGSVPSDITANDPDPSGWGEPQANMEGSCNIDSHFASHQIIFDLTFCGDYGNAVWSSDSTCSAQSSTCNAYVAGNPSAFEDAYWSVNSVKVYQLVSANASLISSSSLSSVTASSSVLAPGMGNTTSVSSSTSTDALSGAFSSTLSSAPYSVASATSSASASTTSIATQDAGSNPEIINSYEYLGCFASTSNFTAFNSAGSSADMSIEVCETLCSASSSAYFGLYDTQCFCGSSIDNATTAATNLCTLPCPGDSSESCGGNANSTVLTRHRRAVPNAYLLTIYTLLVPDVVSVVSNPNVIIVAGSTSTSVVPVTSANAATTAAGAGSVTSAAGGVHYSVPGVTSTGPLSSVSPASQTIGYGMGGGAAATVITTTYVDVCPTGLTTKTLTTTVAECGCTMTMGNTASTTAAGTIEMTTTVKECTACAATGGSLSVTVTVPATAGAFYAASSSSASVSAETTAASSAEASSEASSATAEVTSATATASATEAASTSYETSSTTIAGTYVVVGTGSPVANVAAANSGSSSDTESTSSNGTVAGAIAAAAANNYTGASNATTPSYNVYTGDGEIVTASAVLCAAVAFAALIL